MGLNAILDFEDKIQLGDKTRLSAEKSFNTKDIAAITTMTIKPGDDGSAINVFDADTTQRFLDWVWDSFKIDVDADKKKIKFTYGGTAYVVSLTVGTYTLDTLITEMKTKLDAASAVVWTITKSLKNELTITTTATVDLNCENLDSNLLKWIGFDLPEKLQGKTFNGKIIEALPRNITVALGNGTQTATKTFTQKIYSVDGDCLFSTDADLISHEPDILKWVPNGRASFLNAHRRSQEKIMQHIDQNGWLANRGEHVSKFQIVDKEDVRLWSTYMTLNHLFLSFQNSVDDVHKEKAKYYESYMIAARNQVLLGIDYNKDGKIEPQEKVNTGSDVLRMR